MPKVCTVIVFFKDNSLPLKYRNVVDIDSLFTYIEKKLNREPYYANKYADKVYCGRHYSKKYPIVRK